MNAIREKMQAMKPTEIGAHREQLTLEATAQLADLEARFAATEADRAAGNTAEASQLFRLIRETKADLRNLEAYKPVSYK